MKIQEIMDRSKRLSQKESRQAALDAARSLLIEEGPQAITLKAVATRIGRTHANLLHHFGSAAELQQQLAEYLARGMCESTVAAVMASKEGKGSPRQVVDVLFDAFSKEGGAALASWMLLSGNSDALAPVYQTLHDIIVRPEIVGTEDLRKVSMSLILLAIGDALIGKDTAKSFELGSDAVRDVAEEMLIIARAREKADKVDQSA